MVELGPPLANLGFLFQISGFFVLPSIIYAFSVDELSAAIALLLTALVFLCLGFVLNATCERKALNLKQSCLLLVLFFGLAPLVHTIPYLYLHLFDGGLVDQVFNSWFETVSASSTTGLTLMGGMAVPQAVTLARGINEWVGGVGIVFVLLSSFYPSASLFQYAKVLSVERIAKSYRGSFLVVLLIYAFYTFVFSGILIAAGLDPFTALHTTLTVFSTTGLTTQSALSFPLLALVAITVMMLFSAFSFTVHLHLLSTVSDLDWKSLFRRQRAQFVASVRRIKVKRLLSTELQLYLVILLFFTLVFTAVSGAPAFQAFFHVVDFSSSCGLGVVNFDGLNEAAKLVLVVVMLIGPMSFSIGGGIRVLRLYILVKALFALPRIFLTGTTPKIQLEEDAIEIPDFVIHAGIVFLFILLSFVVALVLTGYGYTFVDGLVESVSAITTTGDSPKLLTAALPLLPKLLLGVTMLVGRIEIVPIFIAFSRAQETRREYYRIV